MGGARILELVDEDVGKAAAHRDSDVGPIAQQLRQLEHQVPRVETARLAQDAIVATVELGELDLDGRSESPGERSRPADERLAPPPDRPAGRLAVRLMWGHGPLRYSRGRMGHDIPIPRSGGIDE